MGNRFSRKKKDDPKNMEAKDHGDFVCDENVINRDTTPTLDKEHEARVMVWANFDVPPKCNNCLQTPRRKTRVPLYKLQTVCSTVYEASVTNPY